MSVFMQIKSDQDEDKARIEIQRNRQNIRSQFNSAADDFEAFGEKFLQECVNHPLTEPIREIDMSLREIRDTREQQNTTLRELESIQHDCQNLIQTIHQVYCTQE